MSSLVLSKRTKADSERLKLQFIEQENKLEKEQFEKTLQLKALEQQKNTLVAEAEASSLEKQIDSMNIASDPLPLPKDEISSYDKTAHYLNQITSQTKDQKPLSVKAPSFVPTSSMDSNNTVGSNPIVMNESKQQLPTNNYILTNSNYTPVFSSKVTTGSSTVFAKSSVVQASSGDALARSSNIPTLSHNLPTKVVTSDQSHINGIPSCGTPSTNDTDISNFMIKKNLLLESFQQQRFGDRPDRYVVWKTQFKALTSEIKCSSLEEITLMTSCIQKDSEAYRLIMSTRASCASNPDLCLSTIWKRLNERFGDAELLESSLKSRLSRIPDFTDRRKLYELYDLLCEIESVKHIEDYSVIFSYLDSSLGIKPIVQKLPRTCKNNGLHE